MLELVESVNRQLLGPAHGSSKGLTALPAPPLPASPLAWGCDFEEDSGLTGSPLDDPSPG